MDGANTQSLVNAQGGATHFHFPPWDHPADGRTDCEYAIGKLVTRELHFDWRSLDQVRFCWLRLLRGLWAM